MPPSAAVHFRVATIAVYLLFVTKMTKAKVICETHLRIVFYSQFWESR